jgi:hypothetical protein
MIKLKALTVKLHYVHHFESIVVSCEVNSVPAFLSDSGESKEFRSLELGASQMHSPGTERQNSRLQMNVSVMLQLAGR